MPLTYHDRHEYVWRDGAPRITENLFSVAGGTGGRSTGLYGTGLYAYLTVETLLKSGKEDQLHALQVDDVKFYTPFNLDDLIDLSKALIGCFTARMNENNAKYEERFEEAANLGSKLMLYDDVDFTRPKLREAIRRTFQTYYDVGWDVSSQPINFLLVMNGFDGVEPEYPSANSNQFGIVIFKEYFDKKLRKVIEPGKNFEFGIKINKNDDFVRKCLEDEMIDEIVKYHKEIPRMTSFSFRESMRMSIYFAVGKIAKQVRGKEYPTMEDYILYHDEVIKDDDIVKEIIDKAMQQCLDKNDRVTCERVKKRESTRYFKRK